ncbi:ABC transporter substrate-binding protein [Marivirga harenae]|uniref:ABC transporter substrate-binding protein n=1 Tax=Marivirga harenae TaxID=2010992 RepID=UPI0026DEB0E5|nr:ABC transporter substrate-binding protein [Marivirga harenae]WKV12856.1 ABC transporter substrate-binding protein [Marivirga harenae]|tara:strand:- start:18894 stop:20018 length:1125 start_codon:yes stop_codon:yes gene_type:complete
MKAIVFISLFFFVLACSRPKNEEQSEKGKELISYSQNLSIEDFGDFYKVKVIQPAASDSSFFTYILFREKKSKPSLKADAHISIPVKGLICMSTSHLPAFTALGESKVIVGFPGTEHIYEHKLQTLVKSGNLQDVGQKSGINVEKVLSLQPDVMMAYTMGSSMEQLNPIRKSGIPVILNSDYLENSPLGRAEWLKLSAILLDKYTEGDSLFKAIEQNYLSIKGQVANSETKSSVMTGLMYGDVWYVPGGKSYAAHFIEDAGASYLWSSTQKTGSLELSFESVFNRAKKADFWIGVASFTSLRNLKNTNVKYSFFDAYQKQNVFSYTKRVNENGANDYLETGYMRPDLVLKDYINLLHPNLLTDSTLTYYQRLNP